MYFVHKKERDAERARRMQYWQEQVSFPILYTVEYRYLTSLRRVRSVKTLCKCKNLPATHSCSTMPVTTRAPAARCTAEMQSALKTHKCPCFMLPTSRAHFGTRYLMTEWMTMMTRSSCKPIGRILRASRLRRSFGCMDLRW